MINDLSLADFVTSAIAHGRITFGDVRRLQRDYLPDGITSRAQAEMLAALAARIEHADRSWKQWFAAALADFATKSAEDGAAARDETIAWLKHLAETPGSARRISRKVARQLRGEAVPAEMPAITAEEAGVETVIVPQEPTDQRDEPADAERRRRTRAAKRSRIIVRRPPAKRTQLQRKREAMPCAMMPTLWVWSPLMGERQLQVQLAAPIR
jgi:hypothetical protein